MKYSEWDDSEEIKEVQNNWIDFSNKHIINFKSND